MGCHDLARDLARARAHAHARRRFRLHSQTLTDQSRGRGRTRRPTEPPFYRLVLMCGCAVAAWEIAEVRTLDSMWHICKSGMSRHEYNAALHWPVPGLVGYIRQETSLAAIIFLLALQPRPKSLPKAGHWFGWKFIGRCCESFTSATTTLLRTTTQLLETAEHTIRVAQIMSDYGGDDEP